MKRIALLRWRAEPEQKKDNNKPITTGGASPTCPECRAKKSQVTDSRQRGDGIRRRRRCLTCGSRFSTLETTVDLQAANNYEI